MTGEKEGNDAPNPSPEHGEKSPKKSDEGPFVPLYVLQEGRLLFWREFRGVYFFILPEVSEFIFKGGVFYYLFSRFLGDFGESERSPEG